MSFEREHRYTVLKRTDAAKYLSPAQLSQLASIQLAIAEGRKKDGRPVLECAVVEKDWPEYEPVWKAIEARCTGSQEHYLNPIASDSAAVEWINSRLRAIFDNEEKFVVDMLAQHLRTSQLIEVHGASLSAGAVTVSVVYVDTPHIVDTVTLPMTLFLAWYEEVSGE